MGNPIKKKNSEGVFTPGFGYRKSIGKQNGGKECLIIINSRVNSNLKNLSSTLKCFVIKLVGEFAGKRRVQEPFLISFLKLEGSYQCVPKGFSRQSGGGGAT